MQDDAPPPFPLVFLSWKTAWLVCLASCGGRSVSESLAGLLPAARGAPHVAVLHPVHLTALLPLATHLPTGGEMKTNST